MKNIGFVIALTIILFSCSSKQKNSLKDWNLNGDVQAIENQTYEGKYENGKIIQGDKTYGDNYKVNFDNNGFITERVNLSYDGELRDRMTFIFKNNKIGEIKTYNSSSNLESTDTYEYNNGLLSKVISKDEYGNLKHTFILKTNDNEQVIEGTRLNENGVKVGNWKNEFDGSRIKKNVSYDSSGKLDGTTIYKWNSKNDLQEINYKSDNYSYTKKYKYSYDNKNNWIKSEEYNDKDSIENIYIRIIKYYSENHKQNNLSDSKLIGIWKEVDGNEWIDFKKGGKYDWGSNENIDDMGNYEYNSDDTILSFISNKEDNSKKYKVDFDGGKLIFKSINGRGEKIFERK